MLSLSTRTAIVALCACAFSGSAAAQAPHFSDSTDSSNTVDRAVPTLMAMAIDSTASFRPARPEIAPVVRGRQALDRPTMLMVVGGALILTGLIVGSDAAPILYLAGAGIGGYGLYLYLQSPNTRMTR